MLQLHQLFFKKSRGVFLGSVEAAENMTKLKKLKITHILTVAGSFGPKYPSSLTYKIIPVADNKDTNISKYLDEWFKFIDEARRQGGDVLVHCHDGISRRQVFVTPFVPWFRFCGLSFR
ncbi:Dual specificity phosphatase, catalytic domain [Dillenia turbinata]|uniref:protein-tyrosine-phosphatase n=1 Tax=Dillenia turbinata TaxID=194707 RepID=A0AAN8YVP5_9MAGN